MRKTPTIFDRDWEGNRGVIPELLVNPGGAVATEKLDGTNVRVTIRGNQAVRLEKRRNPTKDQKKQGIAEPWYVDASPGDPADRYLFGALDNTPTADMHEGEWSAEAVGPKIQGNPLKLDEHRLYFFERGYIPAALCVPVLDGVPTLKRKITDSVVGNYPEDDVREYFEALRAYIGETSSRINPAVGIEGIVWHGGDGWAKLKRKDYK